MTTPTFNRDGITVDAVTVAASPGTTIQRSCGITIIKAIPAGDNIGAILILPSGADVGDLVEVYNVYSGSNPTQNHINIDPNTGETIFSGNVSLAPSVVVQFRKIDSSTWFVK